MTLRFFTAAQKIEEIQRAIADISLGNRPSERTIAALKAVAQDINAQAPGVPGEVLRELQRRLADAAASRTSKGWTDGACRGFFEYCVGKWPVLRQSLERFEVSVND